MEEIQFKKVITAKHKLFDLKLKEVFEYRDLIKLFVKRNFIAQYKQTILGPAWAVIQPLLTTVVFTLVFGSVAGLASCGRVPQFLFYLLGTVSWQFFNGCLVQTSNTFIANANIMGKVYFPRLVVPISTALTQLISYFIQMAMFFVFYVIYSFNDGYVYGATECWWILPLSVVQIGILGMGCGIIISSLTTKYRDLAMLVTFGMQLWMYGTPVAYSLSIFEGSLLYKVMLLNPMTPIIQGIRYGLLGSEAGSFMGIEYVISWGITLIVLIAGILVFSKVEKNFMDTI